ncbi:MAG: putative PEP-binding protein [Pyrinomonadaceae bacterium]
MKAGQEVIQAALAQPAGSVSGQSLSGAVEEAKASRAAARTGPYKHLMTGVSYMLPVVIAGGLAIALAFAIGGIYAGDKEGTLAWALSQIGGGTAFHLFVAVLSGFIAYSIADRPGIAPGLIGGMLAQNLGAGFLGGIAGEPVGALILTGLGVTELSMSLPSIAAVKAAMRGYSFASAKEFARRALACKTAAEVRQLPLP